MSKLNLYSILLVLWSLVIFPKISFADNTWLSEMHFLSGYESLIKHNYGSCADEFYASIKDNVANESRAKLYLADCQYHLGMQELAAYHFTKVDESDLSDKDKAMYNSLQSNLSNEIENITGFKTWVSPYMGSLTYNLASATSSTSGSQNSTTGLFYGLYLDFMKESWKFTLGGQSLSFPLSNGSTSTPSQGLLGVEKWLFELFSLRAKGIYITSNQSNLSSVTIGNVGTSWVLAPSLILNFDYYHSSYPNVSFGPLNLSEYNVAVDWSFFTNESAKVTLELGSESISANATSNTDSTTGFTLKNFYERAFAELMIRFSAVELDGGGWMGSEAFGIRSGGMIIYDSLEQHNSGWNLGLKIFPASSWGLQFANLQENINISTLNGTTNTFYGGIFFKL